MNFQNRYGLLDRALHRVAFGTGTAQLGVADLEERMFRSELGAVELGAPVLITALPRAGTTILLELLAGMPQFAAHTYREMPFVLCPMIWHRLSAPFRREDAPRERAHGDGIEISLDSPEAFEEIVWKAFWPDHYRGDRIAPWQTCADHEFTDFFAAHTRKIVALRARHKPTARRYVSKNNLNVARIPALWEAVPEATVIVPFREPLQHAASLLRQHRRFVELHREDSFARRYMAAIGHHDFGANLKPVDFDGWLGEGRDPGELGFWLDYWLATYRHVLRHAGHDHLHLVGFEPLGRAEGLGTLADRLGVETPADLNDRAHILRAVEDRPVDASSVSAEALREAGEVHQQLRDVSLL